MAATFVRAFGHDYQTGTFLFIMSDEGREFQCGVSDAAMDQIEHIRNVRDSERGDQFARLQTRISDCASRKFDAGDLEAGASKILVRAIDLMPRH